jgi:hypothetical protein
LVNWEKYPGKLGKIDQLKNAFSAITRPTKKNQKISLFRINL